MKFQRSVVWCSCGTHAISVERCKFGKDIETDIQLWSSINIAEHTRLIDRIRDAWAALRGKLYLDGICMDDEGEVMKLIEALQKKPEQWTDEE